MKLKEIHRTATFAWSPSASLPLIATGTVAGALDESFSNESQLEIWAPDFMDKNEYDLGGEGWTGPKGVVRDTSRFNRLAWGNVHQARARGVIAAGMENGELALWDPSKILANAGNSESLLLRNTTHTGPIRGLDFNPIQTNLLSSGAVAGEVYIWDLNDPSKPYSPTPGNRSTKLDEMTSIAWNQQVQYVLAGASSTGYTVVWDLRGKREVVALAYGGGTGTLAGPNASGSVMGMAVGGRRGMSAIAWHPDNATRLVTASEDDTSPVIMVWDLRNARAPEKILTGHEKGVLSLSWCKQDPDLLLSCGKDNRALCWNPQTSEIIGELPSADNWAFQVEWCPRNPDLLATAFFDGTVGIHSVQSTNIETAATAPQAASHPDGLDVFDVPGYSRSTQSTFSLKQQAPRWLRRPISSSFGFGGKLVTVSNLSNAQGKNQSSVVHLRKVIAEPDIVERMKKLQGSVESESLNMFAEEKSQEMTMTAGAEGAEAWKALLSLFRANSRDELITLLGYSKEEVAVRVAEAIAKLKESALAEQSQASLANNDLVEEEDVARTREPVVSFAEPEAQETQTFAEGSDSSEREDTLSASAAEKTPSEVSASVASDTTGGTHLADSESTTTAPSLFGDENALGTPSLDAGADFFSTMGIASQSSGAEEVVIPHTNYGVDSSVAATVGSGPSSVAEDETLKSTTFRIYPAGESDTDRLVTKALVLGDFESAVSVCLSTDRFADAILLAIKGGQDLLYRTQKAYFGRRTSSLPYLRLFQSIVTNDLADIVQNAELQEWQEIFVVLCTYASQEEFSNLAEQLGARLEFQSTLARALNDADAEIRAADSRRNATLTYLAAGRLERLLNIWIDELADEERQLVEDEINGLNGSRYTAHAHALQTFIEKVTIFRSATQYVDTDLTQSSTAGVKTYKLSALYDRYFEYADLLAAQGLLKEAVSYLKLTPTDYQGSIGIHADFALGRERLLVASGAEALPRASAAGPSAIRPVSATAPVTGTSSISSYPSYTPIQTSSVPQPRQNVVPLQPPSQPQHQSSYQPVTAAAPAYNTYIPPQTLAKPALISQGPTRGPIPTPPPARATPPVPAPPPKRTQNGGWNDAPLVAGERRPPAALNLNKPVAITSPFPNAAPSPSLGSPGLGSPYQALPAVLPPPPRPASVQNRAPPQMQRPPPQSGQPGAPSAFPPNSRILSGPPAQPQGVPPPPSRIMSPPHAQQAPPPLPEQYGPPPSSGPPQPGLYAQASSLPGPPRALGPTYARATPPIGPSGPQIQGSFPPVANQHLQGGSLPPPPQGANRGTLSVPPPGHHPPPSGQAAGPPAASSRAPRGPPAPKYPPGDRSHIPQSALPIFNIISELLARAKQTTPLQQKRLMEDLERRINPLFDALNCETLSKPVIDQLLVLVRAMAERDREAALAIHVDLLTRGSQTDDIGLWMSGVKQLIMRL